MLFDFFIVHGKEIMLPLIGDCLVACASFTLTPSRSGVLQERDAPRNDMTFNNVSSTLKRIAFQP